MRSDQQKETLIRCGNNYLAIPVADVSSEISMTSMRIQGALYLQNLGLCSTNFKEDLIEQMGAVALHPIWISFPGANP